VEMMVEGEAVSPVTPMTHFSKMNDQSKISMVELENNGLLTMDLEDQLFEDAQL
jgi:hypothetical protein